MGAFLFIVDVFTNSEGSKSQATVAQGSDDVRSVLKQLRNVQSDMENLRTLMAAIQTEINDGATDS